MTTFEVDGRTYNWYGGFGAIFKSYERKTKKGDVRYINGRLFHVYLVYPRWFGPSETCWSLVGKFDADTIQQVHAEMFR